MPNNVIKLNPDTHEAEIILKKCITEQDIDNIVNCLDNINTININCRNIRGNVIDTSMLSIIIKLCLEVGKQHKQILLTKTSKELKKSLKNLRLNHYIQ